MCLVDLIRVVFVDFSQCIVVSLYVKVVTETGQIAHDADGEVVFTLAVRFIPRLPPAPHTSPLEYIHVTISTTHMSPVGFIPSTILSCNTSPRQSTSEQSGSVPRYLHLQLKWYFRLNNVFVD